jgi:catechol 2,3-dioxygenase-like lactoylglutathione lyase family enzyme
LQPTQLDLRTMVGFVTTTQPDAAREFYGKTLGFRLLNDDPFALAFSTNGGMLRVGKAQTFNPAPGTILGWEVADIQAAVRALAQRGIAFEQYPKMKQDEQGVCTFPNGDMVAWFKDPEGNVLSLSQHVVSVIDKV